MSCECSHKVRIPNETGPKTSLHRFDCPDMKKFWFYYEEAINAWIPAPRLIEDVIGEAKWGHDCEIEFRIIQMTQKEFDSLSEVE